MKVYRKMFILNYPCTNILRIRIVRIYLRLFFFFKSDHELGVKNKYCASEDSIMGTTTTVHYIIDVLGKYYSAPLFNTEFDMISKGKLGLPTYIYLSTVLRLV